jgi:hypothetical protein
MQILPSRGQFLNEPASAALLNALEDRQQDLGITDAVIYHSFPLYRDEEGGLVAADAVLASRVYGVVAFALTSAEAALPPAEEERCLAIAEQVPPYVQSRLIKNCQLRRGPTELAFSIMPVLYGPLLSNECRADGVHILHSPEELYGFLDGIRTEPLGIETFNELIATLEGAKGLIRPKKRPQVSQDESSKGKQAELVEAAITLFDQQQKQGIMGRVTGPQRR